MDLKIDHRHFQALLFEYIHVHDGLGYVFGSLQLFSSPFLQIIHVFPLAQKYMSGNNFAVFLIM